MNETIYSDFGGFIFGTVSYTQNLKTNKFPSYLICVNRFPVVKYKVPVCQLDLGIWLNPEIWITNVTSMAMQ